MQPPDVSPHTDRTALHEQLRRLLAKAITLPLIVMAFIAGLFLWGVLELNQNQTWVAHTESVVATINQVQKLIIDQETGARGYMLTGEEPFLEPLAAAERTLPVALSELAADVTDNAAQQARVATLRERHADWHRSLLATVENARGNAAPCRTEPSCMDQLRRRKQQVDAMRGLIAELLAEEDNLLTARKQHAAAVTKVVLWGGAVLLLVLGLLMATALRRWIASVGRMYNEALSQREASEQSEREARRAAEAMGAEVIAASRDMEERYLAMRDERDQALRQGAGRGE